MEIPERRDKWILEQKTVAVWISNGETTSFLFPLLQRNEGVAVFPTERVFSPFGKILRRRVFTTEQVNDESHVSPFRGFKRGGFLL